MRRFTVKREKKAAIAASFISFAAILFGIICLVKHFENILTSLLRSDDGELDDADLDSGFSRNV